MVVDLKNPLFASNLDTNRHLRRGFGVAILDFKGIDTTSPVDSHSGAFTPQVTSFAAQSVTTTARNDMVVGFFATSPAKTLGTVSLTGTGFDQRLDGPQQSLRPAADRLRSAALGHEQRPLREQRLSRHSLEAAPLTRAASRTTASCGFSSSSQSAVSWITPAAASAIVLIVA